MTFRTSDKKTAKLFQERKVAASIEQVAWEDRTIRYVITGENDTLPLLLFVHGAPGSADAFYDYLSDSTLLQQYRMVTVDRPGYGYSGFGKSVTSIFKQAESLKAIVEKHKNGKPVLMVGHSYGGPIVSRFAMEFPNLVDGLLLLAPANDPENERIFWFSYLGIWQPFRLLTPASMKVAADEKFSHTEELEGMLTLWESLTLPIIHIHGTKDVLVPFENLAFSKKHIPAHNLKAVALDETNHFIPWTHKAMVLEELNALKEWVFRERY